MYGKYTDLTAIEALQITWSSLY